MNTMAWNEMMKLWTGAILECKHTGSYLSCIELLYLIGSMLFQVLFGAFG
jgi:hypothetical protein